MFNALGYSVLPSAVSVAALHSVRDLAESLAPHRGIGVDGVYWHSSTGVAVPELSVWWTASVLGSPAVAEIVQVLQQHLQLTDPCVVYSVDCVWSSAENNTVNPHVDTPYRFSQWQGESLLLAQQFIVPLVAVDSWNGATGIVPGSQQYIWPIDQCYAGVYDQFFAANCVQPQLNLGDVLTYDPRALHSTMPNYSGVARPVLLVSFLADSLVDAVSAVDESKRA